MQLLAPMMMVGAAAVSIPIALHFFYRARYKPLPWAPMRFLKEAIEQTSRRLKFQEWVLLALRCLAIILLALAISRPGVESATVAGRGEAVDAVLVFDTSYSMGARDEGMTRLDRAKEAALTILNTLPNNSSVQIYTCSDRATFLGPQNGLNLDQARQLIPTIQLSSLPGDVLPGLRDALAGAETGTAPAKEIYVFTDLQKSGFEKQQGAVKQKCEEIKPKANLIFVRCGHPSRRLANVSVLDVALLSDIPHTKTRVPFVITLKNTGAVTVKGLKVALELDGKSVERDAVPVDQIDPGQEIPVTLTGALQDPGVRILTVQITGDDLPGDDVLYKTVLVRDKVRVLLVDGTPNPDFPQQAGDHFVKVALNPKRDEDYFIDTGLPVSAAEATPRHLEDKDLCYLLNAAVRDADPVRGMSRDFLAGLDQFVRGGGGLIIGCGDEVAADAYNKALGSGGHGLLPMDLKGVRTTTEQSPFFPDPDNVALPSFLSPFREAPFSDALGVVPLFRMFDLADTPGGRVLVPTTDGRPFIASRVVGAGEVLLVTTSLDERWGKFPSESRAFVPFTRFAVAHLTGRKAPGGTAVAGQTLTWAEPERPSRDVLDALGKRDMEWPPAGFELVQPAVPDQPGRPRVKVVPQPDTPPGQRPAYASGDTLRAGIYNVVAAQQGDQFPGPVFAVNPDLSETRNLDVASDGDLETWLGFKPTVIQAGAGVEAAVKETRTRGEWTEWVLLLLLGLLVAEAVWAWTCGRAK